MPRTYGNSPKTHGKRFAERNLTAKLSGKFVIARQKICRVHNCGHTTKYLSCAVYPITANSTQADER
jgi:hypothetical protein